MWKAFFGGESGSATQGQKVEKKKENNSKLNSEKVSSKKIVENNNNESSSNEQESSSKEERTDQNIRECGDIRTRVDNFPDIDIDQAELEPVKSNIPECLSLKLEYDECFNNWFASSFIRGVKSKSPCEDLLEQYTSCVKKGLLEQNFEIFLPSCLNSTDPNDGRTEEPRKKPPLGAEYVGS